MRRLLIHAGFHKTGTKSVQKMLFKNRQLLAPTTHVLLNKNLNGIDKLARAYSSEVATADLIELTQRFAELLEDIPSDDTRDILISSEDLCGLMPGRRDIVTYDIAPILMKAISHTLEKALATPTEVIFYFSMREAQSWLHSCHSHHVRVVRMTMQPEAYFKAYAESADLPRIIDKVRIAVSPHRVETAWLEDFTNAPLGPLQPIADLLDWPEPLRREIKLLPPANVGIPDELRHEFLLINEATEDTEELRSAKENARRRYRLRQREQRAQENS